MSSWAIRDAEERLERLVEEVQTGGPSVLLRGDEPRAVLLSFEEYNRLSNREPSLIEVLLSGPKLEDDDAFFVSLERDRDDVGRDPEL